MMLPVSRFKGQPFGLVTTTTPWLSLRSDPAPPWLWLPSWSKYQATPPLFHYPPAVWLPEHTHLMQWERPAVEVVPYLSLFHRSSPLHPHPLPKRVDGWISPEEVNMFQSRDQPFFLTNQVTWRQRGHAPRACLLLSPSQLSGPIRRDATKTRETNAKHLSTTSSTTSALPLHLVSVSPLHLPHRVVAPPTGGGYIEWAGLHIQRDDIAWPLILTNQHARGAGLQPAINLEGQLSTPTQIKQIVCRPVPASQLCVNRWPILPVQVMRELRPSGFSSRFSSGFALLTDYRHKKRGINGGKGSYGETLLLKTERTTDNNRQCVGVAGDTGDEGDEEGREDGRKDKRPVASTPVPGSPWCVVWTGDDKIFFFNPTIQLSVWEKPGELIGRDISHIIEDPPHKRKRTPDSCQSSGCHGNNEHDIRTFKRSRLEEPKSLVPHPGEVKLHPLELRVAHFREMMLERGVSAFSTWEKELHKMVFDPRYLLLTSDQRKQVFDQFVKTRVKDEYKEKKSKRQRAREEFKQLLEEAKITSRSTFKEFCTRYRGDQRFNSINRKTEQEVLFQHYITSLKKRDKENRARLRKMR